MLAILLVIASFFFLRRPLQLSIPSSLDAGHNNENKASSTLSDIDPLADSKPSDHLSGAFDWASISQTYPVESFVPVPSPRQKDLPEIQVSFGPESSSERQSRLARLDAVKSNFTHAWRGYKKHAWMRDEVKPISGEAMDPFGGWAATLVDNLGT